MTTAGSDDSPREPNGWFAEAMSAVRELAAEAAKLKEVNEEPLTDALAQLLTAHYALAIKNAIRQAGGKPLDFNTLRALCEDVATLRHGDYRAARLRLDQEKLQLAQEVTRERVKNAFEKWLNDPEVRKSFRPKINEDRARTLILDLVDHVLLGTPRPDLSPLWEEEDNHSKGLKPETIRKIEQELRLL